MTKRQKKTMKILQKQKQKQSGWFYALGNSSLDTMYQQDSFDILKKSSTYHTFEEVNDLDDSSESSTKFTSSSCMDSISF